ncbi:MAG: hypothetical protein AAF352_06055, partial [Pseudomonadota bacterium]
MANEQDELYHPLSHVHPIADMLYVQDRHACLIIRADAQDKMINRVLKKATGLTLSRFACSMEEAGPYRVIWLGPNEWMV